MRFRDQDILGISPYLEISNLKVYASSKLAEDGGETRTLEKRFNAVLQYRHHHKSQDEIIKFDHQTMLTHSKFKW